MPTNKVFRYIIKYFFWTCDYLQNLIAAKSYFTENLSLSIDIV